MQLLYKQLLANTYIQEMCTSVVKLQNDIDNWKAWEMDYSRMLSHNEGQCNKLEMQRSHAVFMQEIKHAKMPDAVLSFMYPGVF